MDTPLFTREYWDEAARVGPDPFIRHGWTREQYARTDQTVVSEFDLGLGPADVVLEIGCGTGYGAKLVCPHVREYIGVDFSREILVHARERNSQFANARWIQNSGRDIPIPDASVDVIFSELVFQYICEDTVNGRAVVRDYLREVRRVLRPGGRLCLQLPGRTRYPYGYRADDPDIAGFEILENEWYIHLLQNVRPRA